MTKHDESLASKATKPVDDDRLSDKPVAPPTDVKAEAEAFDFAAWLAGMGPTRAVYPWRGREIELQARTPEYVAARWQEMEGNDERALILLGEHIVGPEGLPVLDVLRAMREYAPRDYVALDQLAASLDTKPESQINPRFLR